jgi:hypothetical protein
MLAALLRVQMNKNGAFGLSADASGGTGNVAVTVYRQSGIEQQQWDWRLGYFVRRRRHH